MKHPEQADKSMKSTYRVFGEGLLDPMGPINGLAKAARHRLTEQNDTYRRTEGRSHRVLVSLQLGYTWIKGEFDR